MTSDHIRTAVSDGIGTITIDRPARFNSLDVRTAQDLRQAALGMARDDRVRGVVLRGVNGVFCSGADLKYIRNGGNGKDLGYLQPDTRTIPIIALTALAMASDERKARDAGCDDFDTKPVDLPRLLEKVERWLGDRPSA